MHWSLHLLLLLLFIGIPVFTLPGMAKLQRMAREGRRPDLTLNNLVSALTLWLLAALTYSLWRGVGGDHLALGLRPATALDLAGVALIATLGLLVVVYARRRLQRPESRRAFLASLDSVLPMLPRNRRERNSFYLLAVSAGVCEELIYRGFVFAYLAHYLNLTAVVLVSSLLFGLLHAYQGWRGIPQTGLIGLLLALLYVATDALWVPMALHAAIDLGYGYLGWRVLRQESAADQNRASI